MKLSGLSLIAAAVVGALTAAPALAQRHVEAHRTVVATHRCPGWNNNHRRAWQNHRHCTTRWVHHRRVTRCR